MIKVHNKTGKKYLCYSTKEGKAFDNYLGSGKKWREHLKEYGNDISTQVLFQTENYREFREFATKKSLELQVNISEEWLNMRPETGDGGDTVSNKKWINNGKIEKYILKSEEIPDGWVKGRYNCVFNDSKKQSEFSKMGKKCINKEKHKLGMLNAWKNPDKYINQRKGIKIGIKHTEETKLKLSEIAKNRNKTIKSNKDER